MSQDFTYTQNNVSTKFQIAQYHVTQNEIEGEKLHTFYSCPFTFG